LKIISNNILAGFIILLMLISIIGATFITIFVEEVEKTPPIGKATGTINLIIGGEEEPPTPPTSGPGGGGGGGATKNFQIYPSIIKIELSPGESKKSFFVVNNTCSSSLDFSLSLKNLEEFISISESTFSLGKKKTKEIFFDVSASKNQEEDIYMGEIIVKSGSIEKSVQIIIEVMGKENLFDVDIEIPSAYKEISAGEEINSVIKIKKNIEESANVLLYYGIKDAKGIILLEEEELLAINNELTNLNKTLKTSSNIDPGHYIFYVKLNYKERNFISSDVFRVSERETGLERIAKLGISKVLYFILPLVLIILFIAISEIIPKISKKKKIKKITIAEKREIRIMSTLNKLNELKTTVNSKNIENILKSYLSIIRKFFADHFNIKYQFTYEELNDELKKKSISNKLRKDIVKFTEEILETDGNFPP
jgi:hypothetical protein